MHQSLTDLFLKLRKELDDRLQLKALCPHLLLLAHGMWHHGGVAQLLEPAPAGMNQKAECLAGCGVQAGLTIHFILPASPGDAAVS